VGGGAFLDLTDSDSNKVYRNGMKSLEGDKYDAKPKGKKVFLEKFRAKSKMYHWDDVLNVPDSTVAATPRSILDHYGTVKLEECRAHAEGYYITRGREAQNAQMMCNCLADSLTDEALASIMVEADKYTVAGYQDGLCFLKLLLSKAQTDTIATVNMLRASISKLPSKMVEVGGDIVEFNNYVKGIESSLASYGQRADELLMNVILAYEEVEDEDFIMYVKNKRNLWEEGHTILDLNGLMTHCENTYKIRVQTGKWKAPSRQAEQFAAMKAEWEKTHNNNKSGQQAANKAKTKIPYNERMKMDKIANP
jgi:hypothetical protein